MIKKITIDNFMAHTHTELEMGPGVTILTGPNNTGKSAVVEALRCVATNPAPNYYLRHGAKEARVGVEMDDGTRVVWVRTKRWAMYELWRPGAEEPEEYHKLQRKVPEDVQAVLRLNLVHLETSNRAVDIHIGNQREPVFLLDRPDSDAAAFFAASTESAHLLAMQDLLKNQVRDRKREGEALAENLERIQRDMGKLEDLPMVSLQVETAREMEAEATRLEQAIPPLEDAVMQLHSLTRTLSVRQGAAVVLEPMAPPPQLAETRDLDRRLSGLAQSENLLETANAVSAALVPLALPPSLADVPSLAGLVNSLVLQDKNLKKGVEQSRVLSTLDSPPPLEDTVALAALLDQGMALHYRAKRLDRWQGVLATLAEPPEVKPEDGLCIVLESMAGLIGRLQTRKSELKNLETDLQSVVDRLAVRVDELGRCPTCGRQMTVAEFLDHGGCHDA